MCLPLPIKVNVQTSDIRRGRREVGFITLKFLLHELGNLCLEVQLWKIIFYVLPNNFLGFSIWLLHSVVLHALSSAWRCSPLSISNFELAFKDGAYYCLCAHYLDIMQCIGHAIHILSCDYSIFVALLVTCCFKSWIRP